MEEESKIAVSLLDRETNLNPRQLRANGFIPVTVYGKKLEQSLSLKIEEEVYRKKKLNQFVKPIKASYNQENHVLLIKSIERHPFKELIFNIQFHSVDPEDQVEALVPIKTKGSSELIKAGGLLFMNKIVASIKCKVNQIPDLLEVDLSILEGSRNLLYFSDLEMPDQKIKLLNHLDEVIAKVSMPRVSSEAISSGTADDNKETASEAK